MSREMAYEAMVDPRGWWGSKLPEDPQPVTLHVTEPKCGWLLFTTEIDGRSGELMMFRFSFGDLVWQVLPAGSDQMHPWLKDEVFALRNENSGELLRKCGRVMHKRFYVLNWNPETGRWVRTAV